MFAAFVFVFGLWDIFYYVFLWLLLGSGHGKKSYGELLDKGKGKPQLPGSQRPRYSM